MNIQPPVVHDQLEGSPKTAASVSVADGSEVAGIGIFDAEPDDVDRILASDPAVMAQILRYEIHPTRTFPNSALVD